MPRKPQIPATVAELETDLARCGPDKALHDIIECFRSRVKEKAPKKQSDQRNESKPQTNTKNETKAPPTQNLPPPQKGKETENDQKEKTANTESADDELFEVEAILNERRKHMKREYLVKWKGYSPDHNSWEPAATIEATCDDSLQTFRRSRGNAREPELTRITKLTQKRNMSLRQATSLPLSLCVRPLSCGVQSTLDRLLLTFNGPTRPPVSGDETFSTLYSRTRAPVWCVRRALSSRVSGLQGGRYFCSADAAKTCRQI